jgi:hypothetical protein
VHPPEGLAAYVLFFVIEDEIFFGVWQALQ